MRARSIKPGICDNEVLGTADPFVTLLFERLWMMADREGRLEDRPMRIKAQAFPYRDGLNVEPMLAFLSENGFILRYESGGTRYIQIVKFSKHQSPHVKESASKIPAPEEHSASTVQAQCDEQPLPALAALTPSSLTPDSGLSDSSVPNALAPCKAEPEIDPAMKRCADYAIPLAEAGMKVTSMNPLLVSWIKDGYSLAQCTEALEHAKLTLEKDSGISPGYVDPILRDAKRGASRSRVPANVEPIRRHVEFPS